MYFWYATNLYLFYFYTDIVGLTPAQTGMIFTELPQANSLEEIEALLPVKYTVEDREVA